MNTEEHEGPEDYDPLRHEIVANCIECTCPRQEKLCSRTRHDFQRCSCGKVAVDGGTDYVRLIGEPHNYRSFFVYRDRRPETD